MTTRSHLLYSAAAARRLLGLRPSTPVKIQEFFRVIWVGVKGRRPTFVPKSAFQQHFVDHRKLATQDLWVDPATDNPRRYFVHNRSNSSVQIVDCELDRLDCTCYDYGIQRQIFGKGCCKHGYAVLNHLGFASLRDYQLSRQDG